MSDTQANPVSLVDARASFAQAYSDLLTLVAEYPDTLHDKEGACGDWSPREILAHLAGWLKEALRRFPRFARGTGNIDYNDDIFNAVSVRIRSDHSWNTIVAEIRQYSDELITFTDDLNPHQIERDTRYAEWLYELGEDCQEHTDELRQFMS